MIILLSPTKTQSSVSTDLTLNKTHPAEIQKSTALIDLLKKLSTDALSKAMKTSHSLTVKTKEMLDQWMKCESTPAIFLFQGDAFQKLDAPSFTVDDHSFAQHHLVILSALYGVLRPLDEVHPYRLDMKDALKIPDYQHLYQYWKESVTSHLNDLLSKQKNHIVLNLASSEYSDMIDVKKLTGKLVNVEFKIRKDGQFKTVGIYAKRGRGLLTRYLIKNKIDHPEKMINFNSEGFQFSKKLSTNDNYVFIL